MWWVHVAAELGDARYRELSSRFNRCVRASLKRFGGKEEDHAGDGFFATFPQPDQAIRCAAALSEEVRSLGIEIRSGIHTGQTEDQAGKTHGIAVVIGARVMSLADAGEILVTSTTKELTTGSGFGFEDFSAHELKGVPGTWQGLRRDGGGRRRA
jgi:class 3 adenylate cyclase